MFIKLTLSKSPDEDFYLRKEEIISVNQKNAKKNSIIIDPNAAEFDQTIVSVKSGQSVLVLEKAEDIIRKLS